MYLGSKYRRYEQGVTHPRINAGNLKKILMIVPDVIEQRAIVKKEILIGDKLAQVELQLKKLSNLKNGLMMDLLSGTISDGKE